MSLRDQFKKANLLSDKDARRLAHEARVERTEKGSEQLQKEEQEKQKELVRLQAAERARAAKEQKELDQVRAQREEEAAVDAILTQQAWKASGSLRYYFEAEDGSLPWLEVSPREAQELRAGQLCVVTPSHVAAHDYRLLSLELARRVARVRKDAIVLAPRGVLN
ncbi:MAG: DUF2058 family protein [Planctomycetota bacterium]